MSFIKSLFTSRDNQTWDVIRIGIGATMLVGLALEAYSVVYLKQPLNWMELGTGAGALFGAGGAGVGMKYRDEPDPSPMLQPTDFTVQSRTMPNGDPSVHVSGFGISDGM